MEISSLIGVGLSLIVMGFNMAMFIVLKFNDLKHLGHDVTEIKDDVKTLIINAQKQEVRLATQEEHCKIMHKRIRRNRTPKEE
jgi:hypothetical protein